MFASLVQKIARQSRRVSRPRARLQLEALEDRAVPSTFWMDNLASRGAADHGISPCSRRGEDMVALRSPSAGGEIPAHNGISISGTRRAGEETPELCGAPKGGETAGAVDDGISTFGCRRGEAMPAPTGGTHRIGEEVPEHTGGGAMGGATSDAVDDGISTFARDTGEGLPPRNPFPMPG